MFTTIDKVKSWDDLQEKVKELFIELGYKAKTNLVITLANNGKAEVDVYAEKGDSPLAQKILFKCKFWNTEVPRAIVQSFKMDVQEAGANFGIIVSKKGFQSGAYKGITLTTVKLYTFEELQKIFGLEWRKYNQEPLIEMYNTLVDEARALKHGTQEKAYLNKTAFNAHLKKKKRQLECMTHFVLSIFKDYDLVDITWSSKKPISHSQKISSSKTMKIEFYDARGQAKEYYRLFNEVLNAWASYKMTFEKEFKKLPLDEQYKCFNL